MKWSVVGNGRYMTGWIYYETRNELRVSGVWGMFLSWIDFFFVSDHDHGHGIYLFILTTVHILGRENGKVLNT